MTTRISESAGTAAVPGRRREVLTVAEAATLTPAAVLEALDSAATGLSPARARARLAALGPNAVAAHRVRAWRVLVRQFRSALLLLLVGTATTAFVLGDHTDAVVIALILTASVALGFVNEYRAERAALNLHAQIRHSVAVLRDGVLSDTDVFDLVPGDIVHLRLGAVVPADVRLLDATDLTCDEAVLTGESLPVDKAVAAVPAGTALAEAASCAFMGTVVHSGSGVGVVVSTAADTQVGRIAVGLGERPPETAFRVGLRRFSVLLLQVAVILTVAIFVTNVLLDRPMLDAALFALAIAVGITPQLLPAVVSTSLAAGSRQLARRKVLVKRLVCIEDLGDLDVLVTDKTGTLTDGSVSLRAAVGPDGRESSRVLRYGMLATEERTGGNALDTALWRAPRITVDDYRPLALVPFDHERRMTSVLVDAPDGTRLIVAKGAPESILARCVDVPEAARVVLEEQFAAGSRVVAVAGRPAPQAVALTAADERDLRLEGFLIFLDPPKAGAAGSLRRLAGLGVTVKIATGDNARVAEKVCAELGLASAGTLTGTDIDGLDDGRLTAAASAATIFARVSPEQKARVVRLLRRSHVVGFLGDGVNDALALHAADVGLSVDTAADVAKDAADVVLLEKDLGVLADGVAEGRRIFANTIKYVLMGTSSNFGNMFSAAAASGVLSFLPMLPGQILLNNLLYDSSQLAIPTDRVDVEQLAAPAHWDIAFIRRFMLFFGPLSSLFDLLTFWVMLAVFHAGPALFRTGWFVESLATQILVVFAIRTRRIPFLRSRPSLPLMVAAGGVVLTGAVLPFSPLAEPLGFAALPLSFFVTLVAMVVGYLALVEGAKKVFFAKLSGGRATPRLRDRSHHLRRRLSRFTYPVRAGRARRRRPPQDGPGDSFSPRTTPAPTASSTRGGESATIFPGPHSRNHGANS
ncbi:magnesium-translocating P-type ATPase [Actinoplanes sp. NPDC048967]|uniref:magnesium-translocating P-type ATPase n=1 Tax=Actinoplanes sp. NPDC048967 TaxID=3155269 RepID=UPI0033D4DAB7